jgi:hypothetical protein
VTKRKKTSLKGKLLLCREKAIGKVGETAVAENCVGILENGKWLMESFL